MALIPRLRRWLASSRPGTPAEIASYGERKDSDLRRDAEAVLRSAIAAAEPESAVAGSLRDRPPAIPDDGRVWIVALGKAASAMTRGACEVLGERVAGGMLAVPTDSPTTAPDPIRRFVAGHPLPDARSLEAAQAAFEIAAGTSSSDLLLVLLSGGGSSVAAMPREGLQVQEIAEVTARLMAAGAPVGDLAVVRRRLDALKGGGLAMRRAASRALVLVVSDVPDDRADLVASGPMSPDPARIGKVQSILRTYGVWPDLPLAVRGYLERCLAGEIPETPKAGHACFSGIEARLVAGAKGTAEAALREAEQLGYEAQVLTHELAGDAREVGRLLGDLARSLAATRRPGKPPQCIVAAGTTTVRSSGESFPGRNQELVLQAAIGLEGIEAAILASLGTDGADGGTAAAGALVTGDTVRRARECGLDPEAALEAHDEYTVLRTLRDIVVTGPTGTNVGDVQVLMLG